MGPPRKRVAGRRRIAAVSLALLAHAVLLGLLLSGTGRLPVQPVWQERQTQVWLAPPTVVQPSTRFQSRQPAPTRGTPVRSAQTPLIAGPAPRPPTLASPSASPGASGPPAPPGVGLALRKWVGCAQPDAPWMSEADRTNCRERLAAGAANAPHMEGMPATKLAYFSAVAKAQADWQSGRDAGHGLAIGCVSYFGVGVRPKPPPHALKLGPCVIAPPRGALDVDVDIQPDDETAKPPPDALTTKHGPFSRLAGP